MVTIKEIAKAIGVSSATVSRVLNYDASLSISEAKRQAIIETAEKLNYLTPRNRARVAARPVATPDPQIGRVTIAHFMRSEEELADPYYIGVRQGVEARARLANVEVRTVYRTDQMPDAQALSESRGVIALGVHTDEDIDWVLQHSQDLVLADFSPEVELFDCVCCDLRYGMTRLLDALDGLGYERIGLLGSSHPWHNERYPYREERSEAYRDWMSQRGRLDPSLYLLADRLNFESGYRLTTRLLEGKGNPDVIVTANDNMAIGAYRAIVEKGLLVSRDIAVASFNDIPSAQFLAPPLTTVRVPSERIGENAFDMLMEKIAGRDYFKKLTISTEIIWRDSTRRPASSS